MSDRELGPFLFRRRRPIGVIGFVGLLTALCAFGGYSYVTDGTTYGRVLGAVLWLVAGVLGFFTYWLGSQRWELYRDGVVQYRMGKRTALHFDQVTAYSYVEVRGGLTGPDSWHMGFSGPAGQHIGVSVQPDIFSEKQLPILNAQLVRRMTERLRGQLDRGVTWGTIKLRSDGVAVEGRKVPFGPALRLEHKQVTRGDVTFEEFYLMEGARVLATFSGGSPNFVVGRTLFEERMNAVAARAG